MIDGPYKLPEGWRWVRLGEACQINPRRPSLDVNPTTEVTFVPMSAVDAELGIIYTPEIKPFSAVKTGYTYFEENDVLFAKITPCMENGKSAVARGLLNNIGFGSTEFHVLRPIDSVLSEWIWLYVRKKDFRESARAAFRGGVGQQRVPAEFLQEACIPLPPLNEQRRIVAKVEMLMEQVREARCLRQKAVEDTDRLWQAVLADTFPCPGTDLPPNWRWVRLGEVASRPQYGFTKSATLHPIGPKFVRITDITSGEIDWSKVPYCECDTKKLGKYRLYPGDVLFARSGSVGATILIKETPYDAVFASYLIRVRFRESVLSEFTNLLLKAPVCQRQLIPQGAAQKNINARLIESILIPLPPMSEQRRIVAYLKVVQKKIKFLEESQAQFETELQRLEQSILDSAFKGEL